MNKFVATMKHRLMVAGCIAISFGLVAAKRQDGFDFDLHILFHSTFDDTVDANLFGFDNDAGWMYTADSTKRNEALMGNRLPEVTIAKDEGSIGDSVSFSEATDRIVYYPASPNLSEPRNAWSGTVSVWLRLDSIESSDSDVLPLMFFDGDWQHGGFFLRFSKVTPSKIELGAISRREKKKEPESNLEDVERIRTNLAVAEELPFEQDEWRLVTLTYENVNPVDGMPSRVKLYLDGELADQFESEIFIDWILPGSGLKQPDAVVFLGKNYVGDMDDFRIYNRALGPGQVKQLFDLAP